MGHEQIIRLNVSLKGRLETIVNLVIEDHNRDDVKAVMSAAIDLVYDGVGNEG